MTWLLLQRVALGLPTALQVREEYAVLFHQGGISSFVYLKDDIPYMDLAPDEPSGRIWALIDSSQLLSEPAPVFRAGSPFFVVEAASRQNRFEWAKKVDHLYFYMKTWAFSEVLLAYVTPPQRFTTLTLSAAVRS